ncbi:MULTISPECIES: mechanosensitive ion channel family protein [Bacillus]|uniref:mechanosensitive ion channel family protein n=1 Tax=Bacillus TaxID=1386 RepID=UPI00041E3060|nr:MULTISPECIES: mechanosensitive ion channel family protein [Bacillus]QHZ46059.1 mechanosensitive ion channel family protein [Bacillus sp. NSP9.1]WFA06237.1 mechanosensitive ion channel family protein [Bacillus sp. HSf4]
MFTKYMTMDFAAEIGISIGILLLFFLLRKIFTKYLFNLILKLTHKPKTDFFNQVALAFEKPARWFFAILGIYLAIIYSPFFEEHMAIIHRLYRVSVVVIVVSGLYNLTAASSVLFNKISKRLELDMDDILAPFLSKILRFIIVALGISVIAGEFNYDVNGFVAGLGLGGFAFALAAKDTIGNFFGGIVIIMEKPFTIGDWIETTIVTGTVEDISFRSTKIRTAGESLVTVPNSVLANEAISNWTKMRKRQVTFSLDIDPSNPREKVERCVERFKDMLRNHEGVHPEVIMVNLEVLKDTHMSIFFNYYTKTTVWAENLDVRQDVNYRILEIMEEEQVDFVSPGHSLFELKKMKDQQDQA